MAEKKVSAGFRLSATAQDLLGALALKMGISKTAVVEIAVRQMAERERVALGQGAADAGHAERGEAR